MTRHNIRGTRDRGTHVVNCFQKLLSSWHDTTPSWTPFLIRELWIAFKNYYLRDTTQHLYLDLVFTKCCELLSKIIIFVTRHNSSVLFLASLQVVNCFQKLLSSWHDTTNFRRNLLATPLWIAFKNYYLRDTTQLRCWAFGTNRRCELLSKIIIFVTRHNRPEKRASTRLVVNCFQKLLSSWHDTTISCCTSRNI